MNKEQFYKKYVGHKKVVHCDTHEKAKKLLAMADAFGYKWCDDKSYLERDNYSNYNGATCYFIENGSFADVGFFRSEGYTIIEYTEDTMTKDDLKKGMVVRHRDGELRRIEVDGRDPYLGGRLRDDLTNCGGLKDSMDIVEVFQSIWQREETITMTPDEALAELQRLTGKKIVMKEKSE